VADVNFRTVRVKVNGTTGNQDITISGFGTPKAAMFFYDNTVTNGAIRNSTRNSTGYTDGTNQGCVAVTSSNGVATTDSSRRIDDNAVILEMSAGAIQGEANFVAWITDGVRINISDAAFSARFVTVVLINGSDVTGSHVEVSAQLTSMTNNINTVGFEPDLVFINTVGAPTANNIDNNLILSSGIGVNDGTDKNFSVMSFDQNGQSVQSNTGQYTSDTYAVGQFFNNVLSWGGIIESYDSSGFNINTNASPGNDRVLFLALQFSSSPLMDASIEDSPTSTGSKSFGSTSSEPDFSMFITGHNSSLDTGQSGLGAGIFTADSSDQYSTMYSSEDAAVTSVVSSLSESGGLTTLFNGAKDNISTFTGFTATGADFNFTTVDATPRKWISLFIGEAASGGISIPVIMNQLRNQGIA